MNTNPHIHTRNHSTNSIHPQNPRPEFTSRRHTGRGGGVAARGGGTFGSRKGIGRVGSGVFASGVK
eukprot:1052378-Amorphochlora_amoeboformis.AAC.1